MRAFGVVLASVLLGSLPCAADAPTGASPAWFAAAQSELREAEYRITWQTVTSIPGLPASWQAPNRAQGFRTYFTESGVRVVPRTDTDATWEWGVALTGYGRGGTTWPVPQARLSADGHRATYARGRIEEWYVNSERGLEQRFALSAPPEEIALASGAGAGSLVHLDLEVLGDLSPAVSTDGSSVLFRTAQGANVVRYAELKVTDANGRELPSRIEGLALAPGRGIRLLFDAADAVFPVTVDPLATAASWSAEPDQASATYAYAVATAGDVNGDGYSDVIVGAPYWDNGQTDEGGAFVYLGSAAGLSATPAWTGEANQASTLYGRAVSTAGDVNGDGYSDVLVGAYYYDNGEVNEGRAFLYLGSASGLGATAAWTGEANQASAYYGLSVSTAGDVNGDGYADVLVSAGYYDDGQTDEGRVYLYLGSASGLGAMPAWTADGNQASAYFGYAVSLAGDVNGDGFGDVIIGASQYDNGQTDEGRAYVYLGSPSGLAATPAWTAESDQASAIFGRAVSTAGDVNGDGYADVIVGAYSYDAAGLTDSGRAYVYLGSASGLGATAAWTVDGAQAGEDFGYSVSTAGDVDGDGYADVVIGSLAWDNGQTDEGRASLYRGSATGLATTASWNVESDQASSAYGCSVSIAGDVNGDGYSDVIVGARNWDGVETNEGKAWVYLGSASGLGTAATWTADGDQANANLGTRVAIVGDVNGDGYDDLLAGAPYYDAGAVDNGRAYLFLGSPSGPVSPAAWTADGRYANRRFGCTVGRLGDVNGDGYADVFVSGCADSSGEAKAYYGSASGLSATANVTWPWDQAGGGVGDVDGDGYDDVCLWGDVIYGSAAGLGDRHTKLSSGQSNDRFGVSCDAAGDVNGDGVSDLIVGADYYDNGQTDEGRAFLFLGAPGGVTTTPAWTAESNQAGARFGFRVAGAGDVNGDGYSDVIVGSYWYGTSYEGGAFVYHGSASGLAASPAWSAEGNQNNAYFGAAVDSAGDVNGDGYSDVVVGAPYHATGVFVYHGSASGLGTTAAWTAGGGGGLGYSVSGGGDLDGDGDADIAAGANEYTGTVSGGGRVLVFSGNGGQGPAAILQQRRGNDTTPIAPLGFTDAADPFRIAVRGRSPFGRGRVRLEWEVEPLGTAFDGAGTSVGSTWADSGLAGAALNQPVSPPIAAPAHLLWRARVCYSPATTPLQPFGRWLTPASSAQREADLQVLARADVRIVSHVDSPDPARFDDPVTHTIKVENPGPGVPAAVVLNVNFSPTATVTSAISTHGTCTPSGTTARCDMGPLPAGVQATVTIIVKPLTVATLTGNAEVTAGRTYDPDNANNVSSASTALLGTRIGDRVWEDRDGDGIQDAGEPGIVSALVYLFTSAGVLTDVTFTDVNGRFGFDVPLTGSYFLRFIPPTGYVISPRDVGADDLADSDADPATGNSPTIANARGERDATRWDAGMSPSIACFPPDEAIYLYEVGRTMDGNNYPVLNFMDFNQPDQVTGYNVYRTSNPALPKSSWPMVASDIVDGDHSKPNNQWVDMSGDLPPGGVWYYEVTAYNHRCPAEGPR